MAETENAFGEWKTAPDGTAHYVLENQCLCGAKVKKFGGPPERKPVPGAGGAPAGAFITPLCIDCLDANIARWRGKPRDRGTAPLRPQKSFWWRQPRRSRKWPF
jgi:hypothetical protein